MAKTFYLFEEDCGDSFIPYGLFDSIDKFIEAVKTEYTKRGSKYIRHTLTNNTLIITFKDTKSRKNFNITESVREITLNKLIQYG